MHFSTFFVSAALVASTTVQAAVPKANEYKSTDCSGPINYGHHALELGDVTMDDTSHSVYLAGASWIGYSDKTGNGGSCTGTALGLMAQQCNDLDTVYPERVKCVRNINR
ncbi:small secreted protein [Paecilomyces variotii No. 5]|uniref:Small secreted protein n=1 Tax=Byssochlamys spectabilis (strain No. 5 / NBRC 109023) TaxID=1356009 RepID=V5FWS6_BYSSN|nr:small secreted protein [Paecilomyces variotii No. 5]